MEMFGKVTRLGISPKGWDSWNFVALDGCDCGRQLPHALVGSTKECKKRMMLMLCLAKGGGKNTRAFAQPASFLVNKGEIKNTSWKTSSLHTFR